MVQRVLVGADLRLNERIVDHGELLFQLLATFLRTLAWRGMRVPIQTADSDDCEQCVWRESVFDTKWQPELSAPGSSAGTEHVSSKKGVVPKKRRLGIVPLYERVRRYPKPAFPSRAEGDFPRNSALPAMGCSPSPYFWPETLSVSSCTLSESVGG